jgi:hypothetical protein
MRHADRKTAFRAGVIEVDVRTASAKLRRAS